MASVWIGRLTGGHGFEKLVAIKTILPQFASDVRFQKMFIEESRIASRIEHPNVAQIRDVGEQDGITYLVMEYVDGDPLWTLHRTLMRKGERVPAGVLLRVMADACGGLHAAHELRDLSGSLMRVVHRDVSPQNILISSAGMAKVIDFGIAKMLDGTGSDTTTGPLKGKVRYMAPEQARGESLDRRADVWAVGAVLYYLLSGKAPCEGENEVQTLIRLRNGPPPEPLPSAVPHPVAAVIMRALGMKPETRFATASDLQRAIENAMTEADLATTAASVAAFLAQQAENTVNKRKAAIALGLKTAADRSSQRAISDAPPSRPSSVPPPATGSTMRAAAVEVTQAPPLPGRGFPVVPVAVGVLVAIAGLLVAAARVTHRLPTHAAESSPAQASPPTASAETPTSAPSAAPAPTAGNPAIRTIDITELPTVATAGAAPVRGPVGARPVSPPSPAPSGAPAVGPTPAPASPPAKPATSSRTRIDDGF